LKVINGTGGAIFVLQVPDYFLTNCFSWCVLIVGSYCCVQSVQKSAFFCVAEKSMARWKKGAHAKQLTVHTLHMMTIDNKRTVWGT
jgi:hypothetical protein